MHALSAPAARLVRCLTGYRLYHLFVLIAALTVTLGGMGLAFWWLGEQADAAVGPLGFVIVAIVYLYATILLLAGAAVVVVRLLLGRIRRLFA